MDKWEPCADLVPELKCQVTGLTEGQWYSYRVRALNRLGASQPCKATDEIQAVDPKGIHDVLPSDTRNLFQLTNQEMPT